MTQSVYSKVKQAMQEQGWGTNQVSVHNYYKCVGVLIKDESIDFDQVNDLAKSFGTDQTAVYVADDIDN